MFKGVIMKHITGKIKIALSKIYLECDKINEHSRKINHDDYNEDYLRSIHIVKLRIMNAHDNLKSIAEELEKM